MFITKRPYLNSLAFLLLTLLAQAAQAASNPIGG
jgi:hypothetical protein